MITWQQSCKSTNKKTITWRMLPLTIVWTYTTPHKKRRKKMERMNLKNKIFFASHINFE